MLKIGDRVLIYRGKDAGLSGVIVSFDEREGEAYAVVEIGSRKIRLHVRCTDLREAASSKES